jgi:hypothetical protein
MQWPKAVRNGQGCIGSQSPQWTVVLEEKQKKKRKEN